MQSIRQTVKAATLAACAAFSLGAVQAAEPSNATGSDKPPSPAAGPAAPAPAARPELAKPPTPPLTPPHTPQVLTGHGGP
ncbi:MAG: hypothetical protein AAFY27_09830, partial [Pseudomonadota bacterium]